jgi:hypothetical protein
MPNAVGTTEQQKCLFGVARTAMPNDRDRRQIGGSGLQVSPGGGRQA